MQLRRRSPSRLSATLDMLARGDRDRRDLLARSVQQAFTFQDVGAALLGDDLWFEPLATYRAYLETIGERPHLWEFSFAASGRWFSAAWCSVSLRARFTRARMSSLVRTSRFAFGPAAIGLNDDDFRAGVRELCASGLCRALPGGAYEVSAIARERDLDVDLHLVQIIAHWITMLAHADAVARDRRAPGYEISGYEKACPRCRLAWGVRPRGTDWIPPFHPGCRCFAQPRFTIGDL